MSVTVDTQPTELAARVARGVHGSPDLLIVRETLVLRVSLLGLRASLGLALSIAGLALGVHPLTPLTGGPPCALTIGNGAVLHLDFLRPSAVRSLSDRETTIRNARMAVNNKTHGEP